MQFQNVGYLFKNITEINDALLYLDYIDNTYEFTEVSIDPFIGYRNQGNLFKLFSEMNIEPNLYLFSMYVNGYTNPRQYNGDKSTFKVPIHPPIPSE